MIKECLPKVGIKLLNISYQNYNSLFPYFLNQLCWLTGFLKLLLSVMYVCVSAPRLLPYIANCSRWKSFMVAGLNCNSLENIRSWPSSAVTAYYQKEIILLEKFCGY